MIKRKSAYALVGGLLAAGLVLNAPSMATYVQSLGTATQTINAATWDVKFDNKLGEHTIFPGETVSNDTITLTNNNNYPVKYTIKLSSTDNGLKEALILDIKDGQGNSYGNDEITGEIIVEAGQIITLNSHVTWTLSEEPNKDISYQGKSVQYNYNVVAEKAYVEIPETPEEPEEEQKPISEITSAYRSSSNGNIFVQFQLNETLDLSFDSNDDVKIQYLNENGTYINLGLSNKSKLYDEYLNSNGAKFPSRTNGVNIIEQGLYSTTLSKNDKVKAIKVVIIKDGVEHEEIRYL